MYEDEEYSDSDSISDSFEDIDASGASEGVLGGCIPPPEVYKKRSDFASNDDYAIYVRDHAQVLLFDRFKGKLILAPKVLKIVSCLVL